MVFSDGSVDVGFGTGGCVAELLQPSTSFRETLATEAFNVLADSVEAQAYSIALAMDMAIQYYTTQELISENEDLFILSDCKQAIDPVSLKDSWHRISTHAPHSRALPCMALHSHHL